MKRKISLTSELVNAQTLVMYELERFTDYIRSVDPELNPSEAIKITAFTLHQLPALFQENPELLESLKDITRRTKLKRGRRDRH
ncbi:hypothetical protein [Halotia branconii]|uniref:Uncharacterized protein n=1 Tax=Halotia branconii CENA392 TaxID=1539056 RepID=A0AAJ6NQJ9_9CYAN|nr:hypothetical protein [Halotia branconii]WGV24770.1 hypothetical protein QI031_23850 [Halotia branconii CENA392]